MDPATAATITSLAGAAKVTIDAVRALLEKAKGRDAEKATREALGLVDGLQARVFQLQEIALRLQRELAEAEEHNAQLRQEIRGKEEGAAGEAKASLSPPAAVLPFTAYSPSCPQDAQRLPGSTEQSLSASPAALIGPGQQTCGACSTLYCRGVRLYAHCQDGKPLTPSSPYCVDIGICTADGTVQCECRSLA